MSDLRYAIYDLRAADTAEDLQLSTCNLQRWPRFVFIRVNWWLPPPSPASPAPVASCGRNGWGA
jgi:hypothetical protein